MTYQAQIDSISEQNKPEFSRWFERAMHAYTTGDNGEDTPNFLDEQGELIEGIYFGMPNDVYHALPALSSSKLKDYAKQPTRYAKSEIHNIERRVTTAQQKTFDAGTIGHAISLEPVRFFNSYFRVPVPSDYPDTLRTTEEINQALCEAGLSISESKDDKKARLLRAVPGFDVSGLNTVRDIDAALVQNGLTKAESKLDKSARLHATDPSIKPFDLIAEEVKRQHGKPEEVETENGTEVYYGGKCPVGGIMWDDAMRVVQAIRSHPEAAEALSDGFAEVTFLAKCGITGLWVKAKFDWLSIFDTAADVKTTASTIPEKFRAQVRELKYDVQDAFYCYVAELLGVNIKQFTFVAVEYVNAVNCQPFKLRAKTRETARAELISSLKSMRRRLTENNWINDFEVPVLLEI